MWPPASPNLNPLDFNIWSILEAKACAKTHDTVDGSNPNKLSQRVTMDQNPPLVSWFSRDEIVFGIVFFIFAGLTLVILVFSYFGLTDLPTHPPSIAQYLERHKGTTKENRECKKFALATKKLFSNILFILHGIAFGIVY